MKKNLECYYQGIHLEKLEINDIKTVLRHYNIIDLPKQPPFYKDETDANKDRKTLTLKNIYDWALYVVLINGHCLSIKHYQHESVNSSIYLDDMVMLLYLYELNKSNPLLIRELDISPETATDFYKIEQSGYGNILGLRREKDKRVLFISQPQLNEQKEIIVGKTKVTRRENVVKSNIPYACKDILPALLLSTKRDPFLYNTEKHEIPPLEITESELAKLIFPTINLAKEADKDNQKKTRNVEKTGTTQNSSEEIADTAKKNISTNESNVLQIFTSDIRKHLRTITEYTGAQFVKSIQNYMYPPKEANHFDIKEMYKFHKRYYERLTNKEESEKNAEHLDLICRQKANRYISEILFAYGYYEELVQTIYKLLEEKHTNEKNTDEKPIDKDAIYEKLINNFGNILYLISESPACFSRKEHMKQCLHDYCNIYLSEKSRLKKAAEKNSPEKTTKDSSMNAATNNRLEKKIIKKSQKLIKRETYTIQKFLPVLFYCFLYYYETNEFIKKEDRNLRNKFEQDKKIYGYKEFEAITEAFVKTTPYEFGMLFENSFKEWASNPIVKFLWNKRKREYFRPLEYAPEKALF